MRLRITTVQASRWRLPAFILCLLCWVTSGHAASGPWKAQFTLGGHIQDLQGLIQDDDENVYVTGRAYVPGQGSMLVVVKYLRNGAEAWSRTYQTATNAADSVYRLTFDRHGELSAIIRTVQQGHSSARVMRVDRDGNFLGVWEDPWLLTAAAADLDGNTFVSGLLWNDAGALVGALAKYDARGRQLWERPTGFSQSEGAHALVLDPAGNVYVAGPQIFKCNSNGDRLWTADYPGRYARGMVLDKQQNVYVTSLRSRDGGRNGDTLTLKLDSNGRELWRATDREPQVSRIAPLDMAVNEKGETYLLTTYRLTKYNALGEIAWQRTPLGFPLSGHESLGVDQQGGVWLWGASVNNEAEALLIHYNDAGRLLSTRRFEPSPRGLEWAADMLVGTRGQVVLTYYSIHRSGPSWIASWITRSLAH